MKKTKSETKYDEAYSRKESATIDFLINMKSYLNIADKYLENIDNNEELFHFGLLIDKMQEDLNKLKEFYDFI